ASANPAWIVRKTEKTVHFPAKEKTEVLFHLESRDLKQLDPLPHLSFVYPTEGWGECRIDRVIPIMRSAKVQRARKPPVIDGSLDDACWGARNRLGSLHGFTEQCRVEPTAVYLTRDEENLYIGVRCTESELGSLRTKARLRDSSTLFSDDCVVIYIDADEKKQVNHFLVINAAGQIFDQRSEFESGTPRSDYAWDGDWIVKTGRDDKAWTVEMVLPYEVLEAPSAPGSVWGFNIGRLQARVDEAVSWQPWLSIQPSLHGEIILK
ncbi:sugar-binding protein, partial [Acidobacteriota bacterium]